jgi:beta-glucosidase
MTDAADAPQLAPGSAPSFPPGFRWGTATAAHQVEGGNWNNDWWAWEHAPGTPCVEPSGDACDHFFRYPADIGLLADLGFTSYRFSVEWSRIEPEDGEFSRSALDHYRRVAALCRDHAVEPIITLHHFTTPRWVAAAGGWTEPLTADRFARFADHTAAYLGDLAAHWCTLNEPNIVAFVGYRLGHFPPGLHDVDAQRRANDVFVAAHAKAVPVIKARSDVPVGLTLAMPQYWPAGDTEDEKAAAQAHVTERLDDLEGAYLEAARGDDFFGVQTYSRWRIGPDGADAGPEAGARTTLMGYEFWPDALEACIRRAWEATDRVPILVTENGIATADDDERVEYVRAALGGVLRCLADGIDVRGYIYWSLLDNFEWALGYGPTFGLVAVDRETFGRTVKPSARWLGAVAKANGLD